MHGIGKTCIHDEDLRVAWMREILSHDVCFFTAGLLKNLLDPQGKVRLPLSLFSVVVIDEGMFSEMQKYFAISPIAFDSARCERKESSDINHPIPAPRESPSARRVVRDTV